MVCSWTAMSRDVIDSGWRPWGSLPSTEWTAPRVTFYLAVARPTACSDPDAIVYAGDGIFHVPINHDAVDIRIGAGHRAQGSKEIASRLQKKKNRIAGIDLSFHVLVGETVSRRSFRAEV